ncbi:MAG: nucleoside-diphosphate kinase [Deferribacteraceae bacterium]|nr:nucleoside-diphosphate kinase [Deferribacteraceae bacterium]
MERTFGIIKPDAVAAGDTGKILDIIEQNGFKVAGMRKIHMSKKTAQQFYSVHASRPFYDALTTFMSSAPCVVLVLEKDGAILGWRELMGATNPDMATEGTLRKLFGKSIDHNAVHGSDAKETAAEEIAFFFAGMNLV